MIRSYSRVSLACGFVLAGLGPAWAALPDGAVAPPADELSPRVAKPFSLAIRSMTWDENPHATPYGRAVLEADDQVVWELADVTRAVASADGSTVVLLTRDFHVFVSRLPEPPLRLDGHQYLSPRLSNDGTLLVAQRLGEGGHILNKTFNAHGIALVNLVTGEDRLVVEGNDLYAPSFASDEMVFFGSGGKEQIASLYVLDLNRMRVARVTNRETGARQTFPSAPPRLAGGTVVYSVDDESFEVPAPAESDFVPVHRFESPKAVVADSPVQPDFGWVLLRRPNTQTQNPKIYFYYDLDTKGGTIQDWGCLPLTYDQHEGTDFNQAYGRDVVASASGTLFLRYDGCHDTNSPGCGYGFGNHAVLRHSDRTASLVAHGKRWTVAEFGTYACGAVLMQSASSGTSGAFHIHFESWSHAPHKYQSAKFDPFQGACDSSDPSKWSDQNDYNDLPGTTCTH